MGKKREADVAQMEYDKASEDLKEKKALSDKLRDATQAAEQALWKLQKEYAAAEAAYQAAKKDTDEAQQKMDDKTDARDAANKTVKSTATKIISQTNELQDNIDKLNDINDDLKKLQAKASSTRASLAYVVLGVLRWLCMN